MKDHSDTYLAVKDHAVSGEIFDLIPNETYGFLETYPQPDETVLPQYYESDDYISHSDAKRNIFERVYHFVRAISLRRKIKLIESFNFTSKNLLDIGCGTGDFLHAAKKKKWNIVGIEPNQKARDIANRKTDNAVHDIAYLNHLEQDSFDVITLWHVLEHLPKLEMHIDIFNGLLKTDAHLIVAVPNYKSYDARWYRSYWAGYDVPRHLWHFDQNAIRNVFQSRGFNVEKMIPMKFDSYYVSLLSEKYRFGTMNPIRAFWIGFWSNLKARASGEYSSIIYIIKKSI